MGDRREALLEYARRQQEAGEAGEPTSWQESGKRIVHELVKSYGVRYDDEKKEWGWSMENIGKAFQEDPLWTTLDYATLAIPPAKWGSALWKVGKAGAAAEGAGVVASAYRSGRFAEITGRTEAVGPVGRALGHVVGKERAAAAEMALTHPGRRGPVGRRLHDAFGTGAVADPEYLKLAKEMGPSAFAVGEAREIAKVMQRNLETAKNINQRVGTDTLRIMDRAKLDESGQERFTRMLEKGVDPEDADRLVQELGERGAQAYRATWSLRLNTHSKLYEMGLISKESYEAGLREGSMWTAHVSKEWTEITRDLEKLSIRGEKLPDSEFQVALKDLDERLKDQLGEIAENPDLSRSAKAEAKAAVREEAEAARDRIYDEMQKQGIYGPGADRVARAGRESLQRRTRRKEDFERDYTRIMDPRATVGRLMDVGQVIAHQEYAQGIARSPLAQDASSVVDIVKEITTSGNQRLMKLHGITQDQVDTVVRLTNNFEAAGRQMTDELAAKALGWKRIDTLFDGSVPGYIARLPDELKGKYLDPSVAADVMETLRFSDEPGKIRKIYEGSLSFFRASKTAYNPATHVRNMIGGVIFHHLATGGAPTMVPRLGLHAFYKRTDELKDAMEAGVLSTSFHHEVVKQLQEHVPSRALRALPGTSIDWMGTGTVARFAQKGAGAMERWYVFQDDVWKADAFITLSRRFKKRFLSQGLDEASAATRAKSLAAAEVTKYMQQFVQHSTTGDIVRKVIPFASFTTEALRVWKNALVEKPHLAFFWNHAVEAMSHTFAAAAGISQEEIKYAQQEGGLPDYLRGKKLLTLPWRDDDGKAHYMDLSYMLPLGDLQDRAKIEKFWGGGVFDPTTNPFIGAAAATATGVDPYRQRPIEPAFTERQLGIPVQGAGVRKAVGLAEYMLGSMSPPLAPWGYAGVNLLQAARGTKSYRTGELEEPDPLRTVAANVFAMRSYRPSVSSQILNLRREAFETTKEVTASRARWKHAVANDDEDARLREEETLKALKRAEGRTPQEVRKYIKQLRKSAKPGYAGNLSKRQKRELKQRVMEGAGPLSEDDVKALEMAR